MGVTVTEIVGVAVPANVLSGTNGTNPATDITADCNSGANTVLNNGTMNVLREAKDINDGHLHR